MDIWIVIILIALCIALLAIFAAISLMIFNRKRRRYIETHQEEAVVIEKIARRRSEFKTKMDNTSHFHDVRFFIVLRLRDGHTLEVEINYDRFCTIKTGEIATVAMKNEKLLFYQSEHKISTDIINQWSELLPLYHRKKEGKVSEFYCEIPSMDLIIYSYETITMDLDEILSIYHKMSRTVEEFFCLEKSIDYRLEAITIEKGTDILFYQNDQVYQYFSNDESITESIIKKWVNEDIILNDYPFEVV